jgi:hypothetical protein
MGSLNIGFVDIRMAALAGVRAHQSCPIGFFLRRPFHKCEVAENDHRTNQQYDLEFFRWKSAQHDNNKLQISGMMSKEQQRFG